jgi:hypothetical protein
MMLKCLWNGKHDMNPNDCKNCRWKVKKHIKDWCVWWFTEPDVICDWFKKKGKTY